MTHYVCAGDCGGVSDKAKTCEDETCSKHKKPLIECDCEDDEHEEALEGADNEEQ